MLLNVYRSEFDICNSSIQLSRNLCMFKFFHMYFDLRIITVNYCLLQMSIGIPSRSVIVIMWLSEGLDGWGGSRTRYSII